jgi:hypothetical protein
MGYVAVALMALTGAINTSLLVGSLDAMFDTPWREMDSNHRFREGGHRRLGGLISCTREFSGSVIRRCGCRGPQEYRSYERD